MKPLILFLSLLLACGSCKNKVQAQDQELNSIVGKWELIGYITRDCNKEKPEVFSPNDGGTYTVITYHDNLSYESFYGGAVVDPGCGTSGDYSLREQKENDGTLIKIVSATTFYCMEWWHTLDSRYDIVRAPNGDIHLQLSSDPTDCKNSDYTVSVYKKI